MQKKQYTLEDFDFDLPEDLIAQYPAETRDASRLFVLDRRNGTYLHTRFSHLHEFLRRGDLLVFNDARVIPARITCARASGGIVEILLVRQVGDRVWLAASNRTRRIRPGEILVPLKNGSIRFMVKKRDSELLEIEPDAVLTEAALSSIGEIALPPYIRRKASALDAERYQTVYARQGRAAASPTAGLHFTEGLMERVRAAGTDAAFVTLDVSWGTFRPVRTHRIQDHSMHRERYTLSEESARSINRARDAGARIIAVGTTALRVLETTHEDGKNTPGSGDTDLFLYPPKTVESADSLITNFHTPRSTLLMLAAAFAGYDMIMKAYREAVEKRYRFFSYGDAMLIV
jgi:S-adenosylmethionine:tRNA ribosyltransferase-isomerase